MADAMESQLAMILANQKASEEPAAVGPASDRGGPQSGPAAGGATPAPHADDVGASEAIPLATSPEPPGASVAAPSSDPAAVTTLVALAEQGEELPTTSVGDDGELTVVGFAPHNLEAERERQSRGSEATASHPKAAAAKTAPRPVEKWED